MRCGRALVVARRDDRGDVPDALVARFEPRTGGSSPGDILDPTFRVVDQARRPRIQAALGKPLGMA